MSGTTPADRAAAWVKVGCGIRRPAGSPARDARRAYHEAGHCGQFATTARATRTVRDMFAGQRARELGR